MLRSLLARWLVVAGMVLSIGATAEEAVPLVEKSEGGLSAGLPRGWETGVSNGTLVARRDGSDAEGPVVAVSLWFGVASPHEGLRRVLRAARTATVTEELPDRTHASAYWASGNQAAQRWIAVAAGDRQAMTVVYLLGRPADVDALGTGFVARIASSVRNAGKPLGALAGPRRDVGGAESVGERPLRVDAIARKELVGRWRFRDEKKAAATVGTWRFEAGGRYESTLEVETPPEKIPDCPGSVRARTQGTWNLDGATLTVTRTGGEIVTTQCKAKPERAKMEKGTETYRVGTQQGRLVMTAKDGRAALLTRIRPGGPGAR